MLQPLRQSLLLPCQKPLGPADAASTSGATFGCPSRAASLCIQRTCQPLPAPASKLQVCTFLPACPGPRRLGCAVPCHAHHGLSLPSASPNKHTTAPSSSGLTQALTSQLKRRWRTEPRSNLSHNSTAIRAPLSSDGGKLLPEATSFSYNHFSSEISAG